MTKYFFVFVLSTFVMAVSFAAPEKNQSVCATISVHVTKFWIFNSTLDAKNCQGTAEISHVGDDPNKGFFVASFDLSKFEIPSKEGKKGFFETFKGDFQKVIFYRTGIFDLSSWKKQTEDKKAIPTKGEFTVNGKAIPAEGYLYLYDSYNELVIDTSFEELGLTRPNLDSRFRKQKDRVSFTVSAPRKVVAK